MHPTEVVLDALPLDPWERLLSPGIDGETDTPFLVMVDPTCVPPLDALNSLNTRS